MLLPPANWIGLELVSWLLLLLVEVVDTNVCVDDELGGCDELLVDVADKLVGGEGVLVVSGGDGLAVVVVGAYGCELMLGRMAVDSELVNGVVVSGGLEEEDEEGLSVEAAGDEIKSTNGEEFDCCCCCWLGSNELGKLAVWVGSFAMLGCDELDIISPEFS